MSTSKRVVRNKGRAEKGKRGTLPTMREGDDVIALLVSDLHLSDKPPLARSCEDWWEVQRRQLKQLNDMLRSWDTPIFVAGDIGDKWNWSCELINFCIEHLPQCWIVRGQHDLPFHSHDQVHKSGLEVMIKISRCILLDKDPTRFPEVGKGNLLVYGSSWGESIPEIEKFKSDMYPDLEDERIHLLVAHKHVYHERSFPGAPTYGEVSRVIKELKGKGYTAALFGDNHCSFSMHLTLEQPPPYILNPGSFFRRRSDERNHQPIVGLLHKSGRISTVALDCSKDKWIEEQKINALINEGLGVFIEELEKLADGGLDFRQNVKQYLAGEVSPEVKAFILETMEKVK